MQPAAANDIRATTVGVRLHELARQPQTLAQAEPPRHRGNEIVGTLFDLEPVAMDGRDDASQPRTGLKERDLGLGSQFPEAMRGRQTGDSPANHCNTSSFG